MSQMNGTLLLMGSGEMAPSMVEVHKYVMSLLDGPPAATFMTTPAGFQLNADALGETAADYFNQSLSTDLDIVRVHNADDTANLQQVVQQLQNSNYLFAGPGSPTYALNNWRNTPVVDAMQRTLSTGGVLAFASAASLTLGRFTLPVYEIYKVGQKTHWVDGLDILGSEGFDLTIVPHWNNTSGGDHDTRHCYMGAPRWEILKAELPVSTVILGLDEHTACIIRLADDSAEVRGKGQVTVIRGGETHIFNSGDTFSLDLLRPVEADTSVAIQTNGHHPDNWSTIEATHTRLTGGEALSSDELSVFLLDLMTVMSKARANDDPGHLEQAERILRQSLLAIIAHLSQDAPVDTETIVAPYVELLMELRADARANKQWAQSDLIRDRLIELGIEVQDTPEGAVWALAS